MHVQKDIFTRLSLYLLLGLMAHSFAAAKSVHSCSQAFNLHTGALELSQNGHANFTESKPLVVAVASNFHYPLKRLLQNSTQWSEQDIKLVKASSGTLFAQASRGAPFDVFLSADTIRPQTLNEMGLALCVSLYTKGQLAIWPLSDSLEEDIAYGDEITGATLARQLGHFFDSKQNKALKFAIANPDLAPYGDSAYQVLVHFLAKDKIDSQIVLGANVTQAFQFIDSGNAQQGIVSLSTLVQAKNTLGGEKYGRYAVLADHLYPVIAQQAVVLNSSTNQVKALSFMKFLLLGETQNKLKELGYLPIGSKVLRSPQIQSELK